MIGDIYIGGGETQVMRLIGSIIREMREEYPDIRYHLYSTNSADVTERLDKGLLDFGILIQSADVAKYDFVNLPDKDVWGVILRKDHPLAAKEKITRMDLLNEPLIFSRQAIQRTATKNDFTDWFGKEFNALNVVATFNLVYNAAIMIEEGIGHAVILDGLVNTGENSNLCFRLLEPRLEAGLNIVWKKYQVFSSAAEVFARKYCKDFAILLEARN